MRTFSLCVVVGCVLSAVAYAEDRDAVSYVNPLIGTQSSAIGYGGTMPFVAPPFGMTDWTPQTRQNKISVTSYNYDDKAISGFIGTHQPAIWMGDDGDRAMRDVQIPFSQEWRCARAGGDIPTWSTRLCCDRRAIA